jgi:alanine dehydrogenase
VPNIPAAVARTASIGLSNTLLPYLRAVGERGAASALSLDPGLARGVCTHFGHCTNRAAGRIFDVEVRDLVSLLPDNLHGQLKKTV